MKSPCINRCYLDHRKGVCLGCGRTPEEIAKWTQFTDQEKLKASEEALKRKEGI